MSATRSDRRLTIRVVRWPRWTIKVRLTAIYAGLFLLTGGLLLTIGYQLVANTFPALDRHHLPEFMKAVAAAQHTTVAGLAARQARDRADNLHQLLTDYIAVLAGLSLLSVALGWLTATRALRPLRRITSTTKTISARNLNERLDLKGPDDELKELGDTIDELLARLERSFQSQRRFVANASHELRTPLALEQALLEAALTEPHPTTTTWRTTCERALATSKHQTRLLEALLALARSEQGLDRDEPINLAALASRAMDAHQADAERRQIKVTAQLDAAPITGDPRLIERLIENLTDNALRYNQHHGWIEVRTTTADGRAVLSIINTGPELHDADISRLLEPFQRVGADRTNHTGGLGLGLSIVHAITTAHAAQLDIRPRKGGGLAIYVRFALVATRERSGDGPPPAATEGTPKPPRPRSAGARSAPTSRPARSRLTRRPRPRGRPG